MIFDLLLGLPSFLDFEFSPLLDLPGNLLGFIVMQVSLKLAPDSFFIPPPICLPEILRYINQIYLR